MPFRLLIVLAAGTILAGFIGYGPWPRTTSGSTPITVTTSADDTTTNGNCTLREAIIAANTNAAVDACTTGSVGADVIQFASGIGTIMPVSPLPTITEPVTIDGTQSGGRQELDGENAGNLVYGLEIHASNVTVKFMVINRFQQSGILIGSNGGGAQIVSNFIGTNAAGTTALANHDGIDISSDNNVIGGSVTTPGGSCSGDCNLISGNLVTGVAIFSGSGNQIKGNFIGPDAAGTASLANQTGIFTQGGDLTVGGSAAGERNVISGGANGVETGGNGNVTIEGNYIGTNSAGTASVANSSTGISIDDQTLGSVQVGGAGGSRNVISGNTNASGISIGVTAATVRIEGNFIGTNAAGTAALGNSDGIDVAGGVTIGSPGLGNVISGNAFEAIYMNGPGANVVQANLIGTAANGTSALPNGEDGIQISASPNNIIGGIGAGEANTIVFSARDGVRVNGAQGITVGNTIRGNSIHDNIGLGINNLNGGNNELTPPSITGVGPINGMACAGCTVDVYSDAADEGKKYEGAVTANGSGNWTYNSAVAGPNITATATDAAGNSSEFSSPFPASSATPTPSPTPSLSATPNLSPTPTPTTTAAATPTLTPTPIVTPTPTPSPTPSSTLIWGDVDCTGDIAPRDGQAILKKVLLQNALSQTEPCPDVGAEVTVDGVSRIWGDIDCSGEIAPRDGQAILKNVLVQNPLNQTEPCPDVGSTVHVVG